MKEFQHTVTTADGIRLFVREAVPEAGAARRTVLFAHGGCEHGGRYADFSSALTAAGWRVLIPDHRGHGLSTGPRMHVRRVDPYLDDLLLLGRHFSLEPDRTAIVGHSFGGLLAALLLERHGEFARAACLLSPCFGMLVDVDRFTLAVGRVLDLVWPTFRFRSRVKSTDLSPDQDYLNRRRDDPLIQRFVTAGWYFALRRAMQRAMCDAPRIQAPLLILQGTADRVVNPQETRAWFEQAGSPDKTLQMLPGQLHELLQETNREESLAKIVSWLDVHVPRD